MWLAERSVWSLQIWPTAIGEMMQNGTREQIDRITQAFLPMKKMDIATLQRAYEGK
jgi:predicted 3-demethylubiquinone-9 3-methyltransferase (glyoxalase superfamily)